MPSIVVDMTLATRTLVTEKLNAKVRPSFIGIDNVVPLTDAELVFNDVFTPAPSNAVPVPVLTTRPRLHINVGFGTSQTLMDILKDIEFLGTVQVVRTGADPACFVTFAYDFA